MPRSAPLFLATPSHIQSRLRSASFNLLDLNTFVLANRRDCAVRLDRHLGWCLGVVKEVLIIWVCGNLVEILRHVRHPWAVRRRLAPIVDTIAVQLVSTGQLHASEPEHHAIFSACIFELMRIERRKCS